jgi:hypothetical protein
MSLRQTMVADGQSSLPDHSFVQQGVAIVPRMRFPLDSCVNSTISRDIVAIVTAIFLNNSCNKTNKKFYEYQIYPSFLFGFKTS